MTRVEESLRPIHEMWRPKHGFWYGVALIFDFTGNLRRRRPQLSDGEWLARDGQAIAQDFRRAVDKRAPSER